MVLYSNEGCTPIHRCLSLHSSSLLIRVCKNTSETAGERSSEYTSPSVTGTRRPFIDVTDKSFDIAHKRE